MPSMHKILVAVHGEPVKINISIRCKWLYQMKLYKNNHPNNDLQSIICFDFPIFPRSSIDCLPFSWKTCKNFRKLSPHIYVAGLKSIFIFINLGWLGNQRNLLPSRYIFPFFIITGETGTLMNIFQEQSWRVTWSLNKLFQTYVLVKYPSLCLSRFRIKYIKCLKTVDICPCSFLEVTTLKNFS